MIVRAYAPEHASEVAAVVKAPFWPSAAEASLVDLLHLHDKIVHAVVGEFDGVVAGYAATSIVKLEPDPGIRCLGLAPVAVHPES